MPSEAEIAAIHANLSRVVSVVLSDEEPYSVVEVGEVTAPD